MVIIAMRMKRVANSLLVGCILAMMTIGACFTPRAVAANNVSTWGVAVGQSYQWEVKYSVDLQLSNKLETICSLVIPNFNLPALDNALSFDWDVNLTITSISDLSTIAEVSTGVGDVVNGSMQAREHGSLTWMPMGQVIGPYLQNVFNIENGMSPVSPTSELLQIEQWMIGNITLVDFNNQAVTAWITKSAAVDIYGLPTDFPLNYVPYPLSETNATGPFGGNTNVPYEFIMSIMDEGQSLILPTDVNLQSVYDYLNARISHEHSTI